MIPIENGRVALATRPFCVSLCFRMAALIDALEVLVHHLGVHLGGGNIAVAHQLLQRTQVRAVFQQVDGEAVAQCVCGG